MIENQYGGPMSRLVIGAKVIVGFASQSVGLACPGLTCVFGFGATPNTYPLLSSLNWAQAKGV